MRSQRGSGYVECIDRHLLTLALQVKITPISSISHIQLLCALLEALIIPANTPPDSPREQYEIYFVFALIWAYGSALFHDGQQDSKAEFSKFFLTQFTLVKFPDNASVFDVFVDPTTAEFALERASARRLECVHMRRGISILQGVAFARGLAPPHAE